MAAKITVLRQRRIEKKAAAQAILDAAQRDGGRALTAEEASAFDALTAEIGTLDRDITAEEALIDADRAALAGMRLAGDDDDVHISRARPGGHRFADLFGTDAVSRDGWRSAEEFLSVIHRGLYDPRLRAPGAIDVHATATGGVPGDGGHSVPTEFVARWLDASLEGEIVRPRAQVWRMLSDVRRVPGFDASHHTTHLFGGFSGQWVGEAQEIAPEKPRLRVVEMRAKKLALLAEASNELLTDGLGYASQLEQAIISAMSFFFDEAFLLGDGAGKPLGALVSPCTIVVPKTDGQTAATITYANLVAMFARLHPASLPNSVWVASSTTIPQLATLSIPIGDGGAHVPVMRDADGAFTILTRPVIFTEKVPALGSQGDISLCDFSQYHIGLRRDMSIDRSAHVGFTRDTSHYRGIVRVDGLPSWDAPITPRHGATLSPFVTLAVRD
jgi:HK97 family phage major capsid protein